MDTQKALQTLLKIAQNQQKMIEEQQKAIETLKQAQFATKPMLQQHLPAPMHPELNPGSLVLEHLSPQVKATVESILPHGNELHVKFKPGHASPMAMDHIIQVAKALGAKGKLPFAYTVKMA